MDAVDFIKEIETKYDVKSIKVKDIEVWPFLRTSYFFAYNNKYNFNAREIKSSLWTKIERGKNILYGFWSLFKRYDYIVFSDVVERRLINGRYINKLAEFLISELGRKRVLLVENPAGGSHFKYSRLSTKNIISLDFFLALCYFPPLLKKKFSTDNVLVLKQINTNYHLNINYHTLISKFICFRSLFRLFFRVYKPNKIFISEYYNIVHQAAIYTAKKSDIKTVELQHGVINDKHPAYNVFADLDKSFFPDYLFTFGDYVKRIFRKENYFIKKENVLPIGNMYIDYTNNKYKASEKVTQMFSDFRKEYKKIVAISSQWALENKLIDFLKKSASLSKNILYIFVPRDVNKDYSLANFPENIVILKDLNVYQIIREADFHSTLCSTCALEAPALGVPNILINIDGFAKKHYLNLLTNRDVTRFADTEEELVDIILNWHTKTKREIMSLHRNFYKQNHKENLRQSLKIINNV
ncbi:MAG: hypothetical protein U9O59_00575 [Actinomycetota bacterium]|nr:hypothetical protein [Actinomycetota bacterium]